MSRTSIVALDLSPDSPNLTPAQKRFKNLTRQITRVRDSIALWHANVPEYRKVRAERLVPSLEQFRDVKKQWIIELDRQLDQKGWTRRERDDLREIICEEADEWLSLNKDDTLAAIARKRRPRDSELMQELELLAMKEMAESIFGVDLGSMDDLKSEEDISERIQQRLGEARDAEAAKPKKTRPKSVAQQRKADEAAEAAQSLRDIFRKLASALHPDREPDEARRAQKTELMQRVNSAYAANDLLTLFALQLEIEQIDTTHIQSASEGQLTRYNRILGAQLKNLKEELDRCEAGFIIEFGLDFLDKVNPRDLMGVLEHQARMVKSELALTEHHLAHVSDRAHLKAWIRAERTRRALMADPFEGFI